MKKVFISPQFAHKDNHDGGIRRVVEAQRKYLPQFGWQITENEKEADLINLHAVEISNRTDVPIVSSCHGLMWDRYPWADWAHDVNRSVRESLRRAVAHTAPSDWVSMSMRRGMTIYPRVIYHGVDADEFKPPERSQDYILWNKARVDEVNNPADMDMLASLLPHRHFLSTFGKAVANAKITGAVVYDEMKPMIAQAGLYLATTRETFGIGTLEALACGVPVVGWNWGGQTEIVVQGETGYLVHPGDYKALAEAVERAFVNRERLSVNARLDVMERWLWPDKIEQYATLFNETLEWWNSMKPKVSIIVTSHNLAKYLPDTLNSVASQEMKDWECIIVDDLSTDSTPEVSESFTRKDPRFKYFRTRYNMKLSGARNMGVKRSHGRYLMMLDADDMLAPHALEILTKALDDDAGLHIAFGHLDTVSDDGKNQRRNEWPVQKFNWAAQMAHYNQLPYCSMMRREIFENAGGYRVRQVQSEDAELWCRMTSFGAVARKVTEAATLIYRVRGDSKTHEERKAGLDDGPWTEWFPWNGGTKIDTSRAGYNTANNGTKIPFDLVPFGAMGDPIGHKFWRVRDFYYPLISVIIPVGPGHERLLIDALDSLVAQNFIYWEVIVVNDTGREWTPGYGCPVWGAPYVRLATMDEGKHGVAAARNKGVESARGEVLLFLDADDYLRPKALWTMWEAYKKVGANGIIYTDWLRDDGNGAPLTAHETEDFHCNDVLSKMRHAVTALIPHNDFIRVGGFDESFEAGWEDWDLYISLRALGTCSYRVPEKLFVYRFNEGLRREDSWKNKTQILQKVHDKWIDYYEGRKTMPCGCAGGQVTVPPPPAYTEGAVIAAMTEGSEMVVLEYHGPHPGPVTIRGKATGTAYRFGSNESDRRKFVYAKDAVEFLSRNINGLPVFVNVEKEAA